MRSTAAIAVLLLSGCIAVGPKTWTGAPPVTGTLHRAGAPIADAKVRLVGGWEEATVEALTDADGRFSIGPLGKKGRSAVVGFFGLAESGVNWKIQFQQGGQWLVGWETNRGIGYAPREGVNADCDIARPPVDSEPGGPATRGAGFCRLVLTTN
ncbi:MAG: hypothetical protein BWZ07_00513 [Alphaproteobacteria bacterium ADurb.BinA280]|jgi:hypothetical protein|nr:MAG: hypothetical protein BWZ07_00513 [Alphaproteobacteria bacterium ADurb.BinA280]